MKLLRKKLLKKPQQNTGQKLQQSKEKLDDQYIRTVLWNLDIKEMQERE